ncbi:MAG: hypothetical protein HZA66_08675 [Rhodopseudomonas palustris]|uniref:Uncharacterized protein n=1 Tax=Rhodopseudomonas palustris TaxID=1076 RepID=A0A933RWI6_RHOPL|nr:hypothetical protein [Rhodopseudomonas palustris]
MGPLDEVAVTRADISVMGMVTVSSRLQKCLWHRAIRCAAERVAARAAGAIPERADLLQGLWPCGDGDRHGDHDTTTHGVSRLQDTAAAVV